MDPHSAHHSVWRSLAADIVTLVIVGLIVKALIAVFLPHQALRGFDISAWDALMRDRARSDLSEMSRDATLRETMSADPWNRLVFIDVNDETCRAWEETGCTMSSVTRRDELAKVIHTIAEATEMQGRPALVALDIDLASAITDDKAKNATLCKNIATLAGQVPVIVVRPGVIRLARDPKQDQVEGNASIFDAAFEHESDSMCSPDLMKMADEPPRQHGLWFASALVWEDADHIVRRVGTGRKINIVDPRAGPKGETTLASIGLLGGALLNDIDPAELICSFPGSKREPDPPSGPKQRLGRNSEPCASPDRQIERLLYPDPDAEPSLSPVRIRFSVPAWEKDNNGRSYDGVEDILCHVPAHELGRLLHTSPVRGGQAVCDRANPLAGAVIMIGGSYVASGDLRATPLNIRVPGALVHLNAIRAFAHALRPDDRTHWVFIERDGWLDYALIAVAAVLGTCSHLATHWLARRTSGLGTATINLLMSLGGTLVEVFIILVITATIGRAQLFAGHGIAILTPPLVIACEGLSISYYYLRELVMSGVTFVFPPAKVPARRRARLSRSSSRTERDPG